MTGLYSSKPNAKYRESISYHRIIMYEVALSAWPLWRHKLKFGLLLYVHIIAMYWIECIQYNLQKRYNIATIFLLVNDHLDFIQLSQHVSQPQAAGHLAHPLHSLWKLAICEPPKFTSWRLKHSGIGWSNMPSSNKTWLLQGFLDTCTLYHKDLFNVSCLTLSMRCYNYKCLRIFHFFLLFWWWWRLLRPLSKEFGPKNSVISAEICGK